MEDNAIVQFEALNPRDYFHLSHFDYRSEFHEEGSYSVLTLELCKEHSHSTPRLVIEFRGVCDLQFSGDELSIGIVIESTAGRGWENALYSVSDDERVGVSF